MNKDNNIGITTQRIKELKGNLSQEQFASKLNMSQSNMSKILNGMPPSASTLISLAKEYDVSVDWLLGLTDRKSRKAFPSRENITYADVLVVFDKLMESNSITEDIRKNRLFKINDSVLDYLLSSRLNARSLDIKTREFWYNKTAENFADVKLLDWKDYHESSFQHVIPEKPDDTDVITFIRMYQK